MAADIPHDSFDPATLLSAELQLPFRNVAAAVTLLQEGSTVPFIARYRKEVTGGLDEVQLRTISERRAYLMELHARRQVIIASIQEQKKLTPELQQRLDACTTKATLEDLYLPYKPKRRSRATVAKEHGLQPLADRIATLPAHGDPALDAQAYINAEYKLATVEQVLSGARDILAERFAEIPNVRAFAREHLSTMGEVTSEGIADKIKEPTKFEQYYAFSEKISTIPSHRFLALRRGEREGILRIRLHVDATPVLDMLRAQAGVQQNATEHNLYATQIRLAIQDAWTRLLAPSVETDVRVQLKMRADRQAVDVFANNLRHLLLAAPLGHQSVLGIDPGLRTGCKCVALDPTGKVLEHATIYLTQGEQSIKRAREQLTALIEKFKPNCIVVGNGTGSRETETFVRQHLAQHPDKKISVLQVSEAGASVYSASEIAREEFPNLDVTIRGAISIGRRLQDPLAELVKIDPKAIGVGQYQHDVHQSLLQNKLDEVVESCVNHVGVELNTASAPLLARVAGIGPTLAKKIVAFRENNGAFDSRQQLCKVPGMGPVSFQQSAGFLRVAQGTHPLDISAIHPERYAVVEQMAGDLCVDLKALIGNQTLIQKIDLQRYTSDSLGQPTLRDIVTELQKPGRDPRACFEPPKFRDDVHDISQLKLGMSFTGVVTNVTAFGAFVDIGVHQDGLVHISQLADRFVKDPHAAVQVGDKLQVRVLDLDLARKRIALTARSEAIPQTQPGTSQAQQDGRPRPHNASRHSKNKGHDPHKKSGTKTPRTAPAGFSNNPFAKLRGIS